MRSHINQLRDSLIALCVAGGVQLAAMPAHAAKVGITEKLGEFVPRDATLRDETGEPVRLEGLLGKTTILTLVYYSCPGICTPLLNGLQDTLARTDIVPGVDYQVITISFDPHDTAELAAKKRANYIAMFNKPFPPEAWRFLTADQATIDAVTTAVGFHYKADGKDFNHPGALILLSPDGRVMRYLEGITFMPFDVKMGVIEATKGKPMPTVNRVLAFCFSYDPQGRRYVFSTLKVAGIVTLTILAVFGTWLVVSTRRHRKEQTQHGH